MYSRYKMRLMAFKKTSNPPSLLLNHIQILCFIEVEDKEGIRSLTLGIFWYQCEEILIAYPAYDSCSKIGDEIRV